MMRIYEKKLVRAIFASPTPKPGLRRMQATNARKMVLSNVSLCIQFSRRHPTLMTLSAFLFCSRVLQALGRQFENWMAATLVEGRLGRDISRSDYLRSMCWMHHCLDYVNEYMFFISSVSLSFASSILPLSASEVPSSQRFLYQPQLVKTLHKINPFNVMSATTGISNVHSVNVKDSIFSTVSGTQINQYNVRAALDASKLCYTPYHVPIRD